MTPYNAILNQSQPQEVAICELEAELDCNHSPSDITSTLIDCEDHLGSSSRGNQNEERIEINEINLIHHQEEEEDEEEEEKQKKTILIGLTPTITLKKKRKNQKRIQMRRKKKVKRKKKVTHQRFYFEEEEASEVDEESEDSNDEEESEDCISSSLNRRGTIGQERSGRTSRPNLNQPLTYTLNGITVSFASPTPPTNAIHNVGVVYSRTSRPAHGSDAERKMIEAISKDQYSKFKENEYSLKDVLKLEQSQGLDETIRHPCSFLETYDLLFLFIIVCPVDFKLRECILKTRDGNANTYNLLTDYRLVIPKKVALSTAWYNKYGYFTDTQNKKHTLGRDMSWSLLHFKQHFPASLHTNIDLLLQH